MAYSVGYYSALNKKEALTFLTTWVNLEVIMLSQISKPQKDRYCMILLRYRPQNRQLVEAERSMVAARG